MEQKSGFEPAISAIHFEISAPSNQHVSLKKPSIQNTLTRAQQDVMKTLTDIQGLIKLMI